MGVILDREFATAEDTAAVLGVSRTRLKRLLRLAGPKTDAAPDGARFEKKSAASARTKIAFTSAKRRKQARGKAKKSAR